MTGPTRRDWLRSVGAGITGVATSAIISEADDSRTARLRARDVLVPDVAVPNRFTQYPDPDSSRFFDILTGNAPDLINADTARVGYWDGNTQDNPHWVLSSIAIIADETLPRATVEAAAGQSNDEYVAEYDAETGPMIDFEQSHSRTDGAAEWQVDMLRTPMFNDDADNANPIFTDLMRLQFFDNVLLGTVVFGPRAEPPELTTLLEQAATQQRAQYQAYGANQ